MPNVKIKDSYCNKFFGQVVESAPTTLTFKEIPTNVNTFGKIAWVLHRLDWFINTATIALLLGTGDSIQMALTASNNIAAIELDNPSVIDFTQIVMLEATAVGRTILERPLTRDFSNLPGGGILMAPRPLYLAAKGASIAGAVTVSCRGYFTQLELSGDEYLELVDFYRIIS
jgi:hypothetical protein